MENWDCCGGPCGWAWPSTIVPVIKHRLSYYDLTHWLVKYRNEASLRQLSSLCFETGDIE